MGKYVLSIPAQPKFVDADPRVRKEGSRRLGSITTSNVNASTHPRNGGLGLDVSLGMCKHQKSTKWPSKANRSRCWLWAALLRRNLLPANLMSLSLY